MKKVAFTGSTEVGKKVLQRSAAHMKKVSLELGGHCPLIVSDRGNLEEAVKGATRRTFRNMGQICIAINRIYVQRKIFDEFIDRFVRATAALVIADGLANPSADLGPMANRSGIEKTTSHIEDAVKKGARILHGGAKPQGAQFERGYFFTPTILADVTPDMLLMSEESFGPLVGVMPYGSIGEAIRLANSTRYGLASYGERVRDLKGIGLSGQMHGLVALDKNGAVIRPSILWNDQRSSGQCDDVYEAVGGPEALLEHTNNRMLPGYTGGKILWLRENEPGSYRRLKKVLNPKDYVRFRLTGEYATEVSDASGTGLFDVKSRSWEAGGLRHSDPRHRNHRKQRA